MPVNRRKSSKSSNRSAKENKTSVTDDTARESPQQAEEVPKFQFLKLFLRRMFFFGIAITLAYVFSKRDTNIVFVNSTEKISRRSHQVPCSSDYTNDSIRWPDCIPRRCGRVVMDDFLPSADVDKLLIIAKRGLAFGGSKGGASILDLHSGALSKGDSFINIYKLPEAKGIFMKEDFEVFRRVQTIIQTRISAEFGPLQHKLYLTHPTFFSQITSKPAATIHDEYWHPHVDKETYETFHYTSLLYLGTYGTDFTGGRFLFLDKEMNMTVEPRKGRLSMFTSGSENLHQVEKVTSGIRYAITISFTCDERSAIHIGMQSRDREL